MKTYVCVKGWHIEMEGRHVRLLGSLAMLLLLAIATGCYVFVIFHYAHIWSLLYVFAFMVAAFLCPAMCWGFDPVDEVRIPNGMSTESYMNRREIGFALGLVFYVQTYVIPAASWYRSDGLSPSMGAVMVTYGGNTCCALAFMGFAKLFTWMT